MAREFKYVLLRFHFSSPQSNLALSFLILLRFIRRSNGKWTYAVVKSLEETEEGKSAIRFTVDDRHASKSYSKKYWGTHVRPLKGSKLKVVSTCVNEEREGRVNQRKQEGEGSKEKTNDNRNAAESSTTGDFNRGISCPPTQSRLTFDLPTRLGRNRSRSRQRSVSFSPMRALTSIAESDDEADDDFCVRKTHFSAAK